MISRVADAIYWMSRYLERAENIARFIDVNIKLLLDLDFDGFNQYWEPLILTSGDSEFFYKHYENANEANVIRFLAFDERNFNSIISCVKNARENARSIRGSIPSEMWEQINRFYLVIQKNSRKKKIEDLQAFFYEVKMANHLFIGIADTTMSHDESWHFSRMGRLIERCDKTSRIMDVKYFQLLKPELEGSTAFDVVQWAALLKSVSAFEMYRKKYHSINHKTIAKFLVFDAAFPRSLFYCAENTLGSLEWVTQINNQKNCKAICQARLICQYLKNHEPEDVLQIGLHKFIDELQTQLNMLDATIYESFISTKIYNQEKISNIEWCSQ